MTNHVGELRGHVQRAAEQLAKLQERDVTLTAELADVREQMAGLSGQLAGDSSAT